MNLFTENLNSRKAAGTITEANYDDALCYAAVNTCDNCGEVVSDLNRVPGTASLVYACDECMAHLEAMMDAAEDGDAAAIAAVAVRRKPVVSEIRWTFAPAVKMLAAGAGDDCPF